MQTKRESVLHYPLRTIGFCIVCARCNELCCSLLQDIYIPGGQVLQVWCQTTAVILDSQGRTSLWVVQEDTIKYAQECRGQWCRTASGFACKSPSFAGQGAVRALLVWDESSPSGHGLFSWRCQSAQAALCSCCSTAKLAARLSRPLEGIQRSTELMPVAVWLYGCGPEARRAAGVEVGGPGSKPQRSEGTAKGLLAPCLT